MKLKCAHSVMTWIAAIATVAVLYPILDRRAVLDTVDWRVERVTSTSVTVSWTSHVYRDGCDGIVHRWWDAGGFRHYSEPYHVVPRPNKEEPRIKKTFLLPHSLWASGLRVTSGADVERWCNKIQSITYPMWQKGTTFSFVVPQHGSTNGKAPKNSAR